MSVLDPRTHIAIQEGATAADLDAHVGVRPARSGRSRRGGTFERVRGPSDSD